MLRFAAWEAAALPVSSTGLYACVTAAAECRLSSTVSASQVLPDSRLLLLCMVLATAGACHILCQRKAVISRVSFGVNSTCLSLQKWAYRAFAGHVSVNNTCCRCGHDACDADAKVD